MSASSFKFVSPGIFLNEIDQSQLPADADKIGPVVIGRALKGPIMRPVTVKSQLEFVEIFGLPVPGSTNVDFWREGNKSAPMFGGFAAMAYLKNTGPLTFVRLGGLNDADESSDKAGWSYGTPYGVFVGKYSGTGNDAISKLQLAAVIYADADVLPSGTPVVTGASLVNGTAVKVEGGIYKIKIDGKEKLFNFNTTDKKFIRDVLNTSPTKTNGSITKSVEDYFLGQTFENALAEFKETESIGDTNTCLTVVRLTDGVNDFGNHKAEASAASSGWVFGQHKGSAVEFTLADVQKLFKFHTLSEDDWTQKNVKISIDKIKTSTNNYSKFGTFSVILRAMGDTDDQQNILERFDGCTLDPSSPTYIAKKIGDIATEWDDTEKRFKQTGMNANKSKYIRVEVDSDVEAGSVEEDLLPFGFVLPDSIKSGTLGTSIVHLASGDGNNGWNASTQFLFPQLPLVSSVTESYIKSSKLLYWGVKTSERGTRKQNKELQEYLYPISAEVGSSFKNIGSKYFTLDDIKSDETYEEGNRTAGVETKRDELDDLDKFLNTYGKFTLTLAGGFDGLDILEAEPFNNTRDLGDDETEKTSYALKSILTAIEMVSDPEVVEMNALLVPGVQALQVHEKMLAACENRGDSIAIIDPQGDYLGKAETHQTSAVDVASAISYLKDTLSANTSYGTAYFPSVLVRDPNSSATIWMPPSVVALGTYGYGEKNAELWFAPAGFNRGGLSEGGTGGLPVIGVSYKLNSKERDDLYSANINPIASFPAEGIVIFGQKTLQVTPSALDRVNVRRLMNYIKKEISRMAATVLFDQNVQITWDRFTGQVLPFLASVQARYGLSDYKVILDKTTTTPDLIDRNILYAKIFLKPTRAIEFIALDFNITNSGASFND